MPTRILLHIAYDGRLYHGWQTQAAGIVTVQHTFELTLEKLLGYSVHLHGCGRTDAMVHASSYYAHVDLRAPITEDYDLVQRLNWMLPPSICVFGYQKVAREFCAQRSALARSYQYRVSLRKNPFTVGLTGQYHGLTLDHELLQQVADLYVAQTDFKHFCKRPDLYPSTECRIDACSVELTDSTSELHFSITANRFLHNMVRRLVARLLEVGSGDLTLADLAAGFKSGLSSKHQGPAYPQGLYLTGVYYPDH